MEIGIVDYLLRVDEASCFESAAAAGCEIVDWTVDQPDDAGKLLADDERLGRILERMRSTKVRIRSIYATVFHRLSLTSDDAMVRSKAIDALREVVVLAGNLGVATVVVPLFGDSEVTGADDIPRLQRLFGLAAKIVQASKVRLAFKSVLPAEAMLAVLADVDCERLGLCADPANDIPLGRDPLMQIRNASSALFHVHLKDRDRLGECKDLGCGDLDLPKVALELKAAGYNGPIVLETPSGEAPLDSAKNNAKFLRELLAA